jgi:acyl-CoA synthetase (NDP forming)
MPVQLADPETNTNSDLNKWILKARREGRSALYEFEAEKLAKSFGIPVVRAGLAKTESESVAIAKKIGFPLVMKIVSQDILHKSDVGGVKTDINSSSEVKAAFKEIVRNVKKAKKDARIEGIYIQKMESKSFEFVVGGARDRQFGPTVMFGMGGIYVELYKDVSFRLAPVSDEDAETMLDEIRAAPLLKGFRGSRPLDSAAIISVIQKVGSMLSNIQAIDSIDINPLLVYEKGCKAVDVRVVLTPSEPIETKSSLSTKQA